MSIFEAGGKYHVQAVFEQFPWLNEHFSAIEMLLSDAKVSRADTEILDRRAGWTGNCGAVTPTFDTNIFLFDKNGILIHTVYRGKWYKRLLYYFTYFATQGEIVPSGESVGETLVQLGARANTCAYIVLVVGRRLTVFREPVYGTIAGLPERARIAESLTEAILRDSVVTRSLAAMPHKTARPSKGGFLF